MDKLLESIDSWFLSKRDYFTAFAKVDSRLEGWLKAELIFILPTLVEQNIIRSYKREYSITTSSGRKQIDFRFDTRSGIHFCEIKAICISQASGTPRNLHFYFGDDHVGLIRDFKKLDSVKGGKKWVLGFVYPNPSDSQWSQEVGSLPVTLGHWRCITTPLNYPDFLYISVWES